MTLDSIFCFLAILYLSNMCYSKPLPNRHEEPFLRFEAHHRRLTHNRDQETRIGRDEKTPQDRVKHPESLENTDINRAKNLLRPPHPLIKTVTWQQADINFNQFKLEQTEKKQKVDNIPNSFEKKEFYRRNREIQSDESVYATSLLRILIESSQAARNTRSTQARSSRSASPFKSNPLPNKRRGTKAVEFIPVFIDTRKEDVILPDVNLNIVPLGAVLTFIFILCCKCFSWALYDIREWDDHLVEVVHPKYTHPKNDDYYGVDVSPSESRQKYKNYHGRKSKSLWRKSGGKVEPEIGALEYVARMGLLPGLTITPSRVENNEEFPWPFNFTGTSPVASAASAADMAGNVPMCIGCTQRQASIESASLDRQSKTDRSRSSHHQGRRNTKSAANYDKRSSRSSSRASSRASSRSGSNASFSSPQQSLRFQKQLLRHLAEMSYSAPYIPDSARGSVSSGGEVSRSSSCAESIPLARSRSAKSSHKMDRATKARQQWQKAAYLFQQGQGQRSLSSRHRSTGSTETSQSGSTQSSQATSLSSLRLLSQTTGSTSNVESETTSQTNLTSDASSEVQMGQRMGSDVFSYILPKPTWPTTLELRGSYYEDPMFADWSFLNPAMQLGNSSKNSPSSLNVGSHKNSGRVSELNSLQNSSNVSRNNLNSDSDRSAPLTPASSPDGSVSSSESGTSISQMQNSLINGTRSSSEESQKVQDVENSIIVTIETFSKDNRDVAEAEVGYEFSPEKAVQVRSESQEELEAEDQEEVNKVSGVPDSHKITQNCGNDQNTKGKAPTILVEQPPGGSGDKEVDPSRISALKSRMSLPLVKVSDKNYTYLRPRSKTFSNLKRSKKEGVDGNLLVEKLNNIVKDISPETMTPGKRNFNLGAKRRNVLSVCNEFGDTETEV